MRSGKRVSISSMGTLRELAIRLSTQSSPSLALRAPQLPSFTSTHMSLDLARGGIDDASGPRDAQIDDLDILLREARSVLAQVNPFERPAQVLEERLVDGAGGRRRAQLVALPLVAAFGVPGEAHALGRDAVAFELLARGVLQGRIDLGQALRVGVADQLKVGTREVVADVGGEQTERGRDSGVDRDHQARDSDFGRDVEGEQGPAPPKATSANSRGSYPLRTLFTSIAWIMLWLAILIAPSAACSTVMPSGPASFSSRAARARPASRATRPPRCSWAATRPRISWQSVTVGCVPPSP